MARLLGRGQLGICMRSGIKCHASELVRDGRNPALLVLPEWADAAHPQERPYVPMDTEGTPQFPVMPETPKPNVDPVLTANAFATPRVVLTWTAARRAAGPRVEAYDIYRAVGTGAAAFLTTFTVAAESLRGVPAPALTYTDNAVSHSVSYSYYLVARADSFSQTSNTRTVSVP